MLLAEFFYLFIACNVTQLQQQVQNIIFSWNRKLFQEESEEKYMFNWTFSLKNDGFGAQSGKIWGKYIVIQRHDNVFCW